MKSPEELFQFIEHALQAIGEGGDSDGDRIKQTYQLVSQFFLAASEDEPLHFTTLFARIAHVCTRNSVPFQLIRGIQRFRIDAENFLRKGSQGIRQREEDVWILGANYLHDVASFVLGARKSAPTAKLIGKRRPKSEYVNDTKTTFKRHANLVAFEIDTAREVLKVYDAEQAEHEIILKYGDAGRSELYKENILQAVSLIGFPLTLSAIDIEVDSEGSYSPRILVIEPDYLIDISMIAECYQESGGDVRLYLPKKYQESRTSTALLIGKIANFFLDELIHDPGQSFDALYPKSFFLNPIEFATLTDEEVIQMTRECRVHFMHLQRVVTDGFGALGMDYRKMYIEPAFFCPAYGIQGRLDLFLNDAGQRNIIELKSGQPFQANAYGLSSSHYAQTLLYDLMIRAVYGFQGRQTCYILYSKMAENTLRYAPPVEAIQREVIRLRNDMLLLECALGSQEADDPGWFERIHPDAFPETTGFLQRDIIAFDGIWQNLDPLERKYIRIFSRFIAREQYLAKVGEHGSDQANGLAGLWLDSDVEKEERFSIYPDLEIRDIYVNPNHDAYIVFHPTHENNTLTNFRIGDVAVLYPVLETTPSILHSQIYKCTVTAIQREEVVVRLRSHQVNYEDLRGHGRWNLEHDLYDRSFNNMHSALFTLAKTPAEKRSLFLGRRMPEIPEISSEVSTGTAHPGILDRIIKSKEYFLLWGPPGTGKTSHILHHLVKHHLENTSDTLVLLAFTNRAVDEVCEALDAIGGNVRDLYVRIGSHVSSGERFLPQLLGNKISGMTRRKEIVTFLRSQRVVVGTVAALNGRTELFRIIQPDIAIVDEASQLLEPMLSGLLPLFRKWVLIGDHKQLPAVVGQPGTQTRLGLDAIEEIALEDTRDSYFERMYALCKRNGWTWAFGHLTEQGRMHAEVMEFPRTEFYENELALISSHLTDDRDYLGPLHTPVAPEDDPIEKLLGTQRMLFFPSEADPMLRYSKTHDQEAAIVAELVEHLQHLYGRMPEIGVITPFRAQIANIRSHLAARNIDSSLLTIDTVERYQGSARDIVILSLSVHHSDQLRRVVSVSRDGIDRKLNVAITRAREQFILLGSEAILKTNKTYWNLVNACVTGSIAIDDQHRRPLMSDYRRAEAE